MRRFISSVLAILILVLSCFPCSDMDGMPANDKATETVIKTTCADDCGDSHAMDICSPFCTCSCCAGFALPQIVTLACKAVPVFTERVFAAYRQQSAADVHLPIWQPPQLV